MNYIARFFKKKELPQPSTTETDMATKKPTKKAVVKAKAKAPAKKTAAKKKR